MPLQQPTSVAHNTSERLDRVRDRLSVCYVYSVLHNAHSGTERHLLGLVRSLDRERFDPLFVVLQTSDFADAWSDPAVPLHVLGFRSIYRASDWYRIWSLARMLKQRNVRVVELHSPEGQLVGTMAARLAGVPAIISCRRNSGYSYGWKARMQTKLTNRFVTCFLANAQEVIDKVSPLENIHPNRFDLIYNGVDLEAFGRDRQGPVVEAFQEACQGHSIVSVAANLRPIKNLSMFLRAAQHVTERRKDVKFAIMGAGPEESVLKQLSAALGISDHVLWLGAVTPVAPYLDRSTVACLSSDSEGFSNAIVEYMAAGLPVVATKVGGAAEAIREGQTGFLVPRGDHHQMGRRILDLLDDVELQRSLGQAGRRRVEEEFSLQKQMSGYEQLYQKLCGLAD